MELAKIYGGNAKSTASNITWNNLMSVACSVVGMWFMVDLYLPGMPDLPRGIIALIGSVYIQVGIMATVNGICRHLVHGKFKGVPSFMMFSTTLLTLTLYLAVNFYVSDEGRRMVIDELFDTDVKTSYDSITQVKAGAYKAAAVAYSADTARITASFATNATDVARKQAAASIEADMRRWAKLKKTDPKEWVAWAQRSYAAATDDLRALTVAGGMGSSELERARNTSIANALRTYNERITKADKEWAVAKTGVDATRDAVVGEVDARKNAWSTAYFLLVLLSTFGIVGFTLSVNLYMKIAKQEPPGEEYKATGGRKRLTGEIVMWIQEWFAHAADTVRRAREQAKSQRTDVDLRLPNVRRFASLIALTIWVGCGFYVISTEGKWNSDLGQMLATAYVGGSVLILALRWVNNLIWDQLEKEPVEAPDPKPSRPTGEQRWDAAGGSKHSPTRAREPMRTSTPPRSSVETSPGVSTRKDSSVERVSTHAVAQKTITTPGGRNLESFSDDLKTHQGRMRGWRASLRTTSDPNTREVLKNRIALGEVHEESLKG